MILSLCWESRSYGSGATRLHFQLPNLPPGSPFLEYILIHVSDIHWGVFHFILFKRKPWGITIWASGLEKYNLNKLNSPFAAKCKTAYMFCRYSTLLLIELTFPLPSLLVSFSPNIVSFARSSDAWMCPFFSLSVILRASRISVFGSSCCICLCIMVRNVEKSSSPVFSNYYNEAQMRFRSSCPITIKQW